MEPPNGSPSSSQMPSDSERVQDSTGTPPQELGPASEPPNASGPDTTPAQPPQGIFIARGMQVSIANFSITVGSDGQPSTSLSLNLSLEMAPYWLDITLEHLSDAAEAHERVLESIASAAGNEHLASCLEAEFRASMQAMAAAGISLDAFYARVKEFVEIPIDMREAWQRNRTARYKRLSEVFRRAFVMTQPSADLLTTTLKQVFEYRDWAVHPPAEGRSPLRHPQIGIITEWRLVNFRFENARELAKGALSIVHALLGGPRENLPQLASYCESTRPRVDEIVGRWANRYGPMT